MRDRFDLDQEINRDEALELARKFWSRLYNAGKSSPSLLIISIFLSLSLWVFVTDTENTREIDSVPGFVPVVPVSIASNLAIANVPPTLKIFVAATTDRWETLTSADFQARLNLNDYPEGEHLIDIAPHIEFADKRSVRLVEVTPSQITIILEPRITKTFPVEYQIYGSLVAGLRMGQVQFAQQDTTVTGPKSLVEKIDSVAMDLDLNELAGTSQRTLALHAYDSSGGEIGGVRLNPPSMEVDIEILETQIVKKVPIVPSVKGNPAQGFTIAGVQIFPANVEIAGERNLIGSVESIYTNEIQLENISQDISRKIGLQIPANIEIEGNQFVDVEISVISIQGQIEMTFPVAIEGLGPQLELSQIPVLSIKLSGPVNQLNQVWAVGALAKIELTGLEVGVHTVQLVFDIPEGIIVLTELEPNVDVELIATE